MTKFLWKRAKGLLFQNERFFAFLSPPPGPFLHASLLLGTKTIISASPTAVLSFLTIALEVLQKEPPFLFFFLLFEGAGGGQRTRIELPD